MSAEPESLMTRYAAARSLQQLIACVRDYEEMRAPQSPSGPKVRLALTGKKISPPIDYTLALLPKEVAMSRLHRVIGVPA